VCCHYHNQTMPTYPLLTIIDFIDQLKRDVVDPFKHPNTFSKWMLRNVNKQATAIQALARGVLTRRKIHFALLSADADALRRIM